MAIDSNTQAVGIYGSVKNVQNEVEASVLERKILIIGTKLATKTGLAVEEEIRAYSPEQIGSEAGFGSMLHRLAVRAFEGGQGVELWYVAQDESSGAVAATGEIDFTGSTGVESGTLAVYIAGIRVPVTISADMTVEEIADAVVAKITAEVDLPVSASKTASTFEVVITSKSAGPWGNDIDISLNLLSDDETPTGITAVITDMASGAGLPDISDALDAIGTTGTDSQNEKYYTDLIHGYGYDTTTMDTISTYNGAGNDFTGNYKKTIARPFRSLIGDVTAGTSGLSALIAIGDARTEDRTQSIIAAPGSQSHPQEIASYVVGLAAFKNNSRAQASLYEVKMSQFRPGDKADRWTDDQTNRESAVDAGISTTMVKSGILVIQNLLTFYHPDSISVSSNGYRSYRNISLVSQNILNSLLVNDAREKWQDISIHDDIADVTDEDARLKARDVDTVIDDRISLFEAWAAAGWLYSLDFSIEKIKETSAVTARTGGDGFDTTISLIPAGEGGIMNTTIQFDTSIAAAS